MSIKDLTIALEETGGTHMFTIDNVEWAIFESRTRSGNAFVSRMGSVRVAVFRNGSYIRVDGEIRILDSRSTRRICPRAI